MSQALEKYVERHPAVLTNEQLKYIANTEFVPRGLRGNLPAILACVAIGRELGIGDMAALRSVHIIDGKATLGAELMVQLVRRDGHSIQGSVQEGAATVIGKRADNGDEMQVTWTLEMAERAGLVTKRNWKEYPESMLWARAVSQLCRMLFADCFAGATYTTEELGEERTGIDAAPYVDEDDLPFDDSAGEPNGASQNAGVPQAAEAEPASPAEQTAASVVESDLDLSGASGEGNEPVTEAAVINQRQRSLMWARARERNLSEDDMRAIFRDLTGQESSAGIPAALFDAVLAAIESKVPA